ncbi:MAG: hypothetical protein OQL20_00850, partial [Sedimenticola sp.]|nr:hypothetical protein [Sedimenticola sp.]
MKKLFKSLSVVAILLLSSNAKAATILFGDVGTDYYSYGTEMVGYLSGAGHSVTRVSLYNSYVPSDLTGFDQIWVYDLEGPGSDNNTFQSANYSSIANWFDSQSHDLIVDGRILSSTTY